MNFGTIAFLGPEHRAFLSRISLYAFALYFVVPLILGITLPFSLGLTDQPLAEFAGRLSFLVATAGVSFLIAFLPSFLFSKPGLLRRVYELALFPAALICTVAQVIMYREFGTGIDDRILGLFDGNFSALWAFAQKEYAIGWAIAAASIATLGIFLWLRTTERALWKPTVPLGIGAGFVVAAAAAISLGLEFAPSRLEHYHAGKLSGAPAFEMVRFLGEEAFGKHQAGGVRAMLQQSGEIRSSTRGELTERLGEEPESFMRRTVRHPAWLKKRPSHVFLFVMESMEYDLLVEPELAPVAPRLRDFRRHGISIPNFYAASGATIDAIHSSLAGVAPQARYPHPRVLQRIKLDSLPAIFERAGYSSHFFAASYRKFSRKGDSCEAYGYHQFIGLPDLQPEQASNEWGVHDGQFFDWARTELAYASSPRFVTFLNVSYHSPYDASKFELGDDPQQFDDTVVKHFYGQSRAEQLNYASHAHYADREIGEMVDTLVEQHPDALFCFVADHCGPKLRINTLQKVPFILWNDSIIEAGVDTSEWFGSHMDVPAMLADLVLPPGETFLTLGEPCWARSDESVSIAGSGFLNRLGYWTKSGKLLADFASPNSSGPPPQFKQEDLVKVSALEALSWGILNEEDDFLELPVSRRVALSGDPNSGDRRISE